jgi:hypothetical protein
MLPPHRGGGGGGGGDAAAADPDFFCFNRLNRGDDAWIGWIEMFDTSMGRKRDEDTKPNRKKK